MTTTFIIFTAIIIIGVSAALGRADGSSFLGLKNWVEKTIITLLLVWPLTQIAGIYGLIGMIGMAGISTGHGQYFLALSEKFVFPEKLDFVVRLFFGKDPRTAPHLGLYRGVVQQTTAKKYMKEYGLKKLYYRCLFGLGVTGLAVGLPMAGVCIWFGSYVAAGLYGSLALAKPLAYFIGNKFFYTEDDAGSAAAEWINGGLRGLVSLGVLLMGAAWT